MDKAWQKLNLEGGGLQAMNAALARQMRSRSFAYLAWLGFPLGLHRIYLMDRRGAIGFMLLTLVSAAAWLWLPAPAWMLSTGALAAWALFDLYWIDGRVVAINKKIRMQLFLRKGQRPPKEYRGRYTDDNGKAIEVDLAAYTRTKESERAGHVRATPDAKGHEDATRKRMPSFNEQEAMLRELSRRKKPDRPDA
jgi:hypothetical protein